jgi:hypothetical protein
MNYLAVLIGAVLYLLFQLNGILNSPKFKWAIFLKTNIVVFIINIIFGFALVFGKDVQDVYPITFVSAIMLGLSGQVVIKKLSNIADKDKDTFIGINQEAK